MREANFSNDQQYQLKRLELGEAGEEILIEYLQEYGCEHWLVLKNIWFNNYGICENDILLLTNHGIYVFEVKKYKL